MMKANYKVWSVLLMLVLILFTAEECDTSAADEADSKLVDDQQQVYQIKQPLPFFDYSFERSVFTQIYRARNDALNTWSIWRSDTGIIEDWCPSIGFGIPYDTQLTNPVKVAYYRSGSTVVIEQAEPNGLFSSKNTAATWVLCQLPNGDVAPVYVEDKVTVYPWPIRVDLENNRIVHLYDEGTSIKLDTDRE